MHIGIWGQPGTQAATYTADAELLWGGGLDKIEVLQQGVILNSGIADAANTPTTVVRKGLLLGRITSTGQYKEWDGTLTDGRQDLRGVLGNEFVAVDQFGTARGGHAPMIVKAPLKASSLRILGAAMVGHTQEYLARVALYRMGCRLDDDPQGFLSGLVPRYITKATNYTVVAADQGTVFVQKTADATFTLPAIKPGLHFRFIQSADFEMKIASAAGDDVVVGGDKLADGITFTTDGQQIGAQVDVESMYFDGVLSWILTIPPAPYGTGLATMAFSLQT